MAIGDAIGSRVEFMHYTYKSDEVKDMGEGIAGKFNLQPGQWTDDSSMGLCLADSLIEKDGNFEPKDIMMRFLLWWFQGYNNAFRLDKNRKNKHSVGLGGNISGSLYNYLNEKGKNAYTEYGDKNTSGNGKIMRNSSISILYFKDEKKALECAKNQSLITHKGDEAAGCCQLLTYIIIKILNMKRTNNKNENSKKTNIDSNINQQSLKEILENITKDFKCDYESVNCLAQSKKERKDRNWDWKKEERYKYSETRAKKQPGNIGSYCMDCLAMALNILYTTKIFKETILKAVNIRGDADSLGSVVGQIAGAFYGLKGIPGDWVKTINQWDDNEIALRGYIFCHLAENL